MEERRDGSFGPIKDLPEFFKEMTDPKKDFSQVKAFHFGTEKELEEVKTSKNIEQRLEVLEDEMKSFKDNDSDFITTPTTSEIKFYNNDPDPKATEDILFSPKEIHDRQTAFQSKKVISMLSRKKR